MDKMRPTDNFLFFLFFDDPLYFFSNQGPEHEHNKVSN